MARPAVHLVISTGVATLQWIRTGRAAPTLAPFVSGFLVDGDHALDLIRYQCSGKRLSGRIILALHGWEFIPVLVLVEKLLCGRLAGGLLLGYVAHLVVDQLTNKTTHPLTYFITFRARLGFPTRLFGSPDGHTSEWINEPIWRLWKHF